MIKNLVILFSLAFLAVVVLQGIPAYKVWNKASNITKELNRNEVLSFMPKPDQEWAKASSLDIWVKDFLFGGVRVDISYSGNNCNWHNRINAGKSCKVDSIDKIYYTLWGNNWFLAHRA